MLDPRRLSRYYRLRFTRLRGDPRFLARGVALGTFIGITPTIPLHTIVTLALALILRTSKIPALLATVVVSNPLTFFLQYYLSWRIGNFIHPGVLSWERVTAMLTVIKNHASFSESIHAVLTLGFDAATVLLSGGIVLALPFALCAYFISLRFFSMVADKRKTKNTDKNNEPG